MLLAGFPFDEIDALALENYESGIRVTVGTHTHHSLCVLTCVCVCVCVGNIVVGLAVVDTDDFTYTIPEGDISFNDPSGNFTTRTQGNVVFITVQTPRLAIGVRVTL